MVRTAIFLFIVTMSLAGYLQGQTEPASIPARVHWLTIHARTPEAFDSLYGLFAKGLQLPVYYSPETHGARRYAAVVAGRVIVEPCGPWPASPYRGSNVLARFNSLIFRATNSTAVTVAELDARHIEHDPPRTPSWAKSQVEISVTGLSSEGMPVTLTERISKSEDLSAQVNAFRDEFAARKGGPLGIVELEEIHIGYAGAERLAKWQAFLAPIQATNSLWGFSEKPGLRLVREERDEVVAMVFKVKSLTEAARQLKKMGLLGEVRENIVSIASSRACGLRILLRE